MDRTLFAFIWKYSKRDQIILLLVTLLTFPFLYATLELPKRIINDAIGATVSTFDAYGVELTQVQFLMVLCFAFLAAVLTHGLLKMRLNTMKGVLSERLLRRFRYQLISRILRFPRPYFRRTSQGELVSMITSEAEPMGGLMGDAVAQPVFQAGQMLTILFFLFVQSFWFGLASVALIPLQAWLIPMLQRQINQLNKARIGEVRHLASEIGESAAGIGDLRINGGWRYRLAGFTDRLGRLFDIRFQIYQKKFFMKFLNNFITQLTPFFFFSVGGYLVIKGEITVGALVAALAAYKDLSAPWRELLLYYNQVQDMSLRWLLIAERFAPKGMIDETLFLGRPDEIPRLSGAISLKDVTVRDGDGNPVLEDINLDIPAHARVAVKSSSQVERTAFAELLTREVVPSRGKVLIGDQDLNELHQAVIAARIGYAHSQPYLFDGTLGENLLMPLNIMPHGFAFADEKKEAEAKRTGNSVDPFESDWLDPSLADLSSPDDIGAWWFKLVETMGLDDGMFRRSVRSTFDPERHPDLAKAVVDLRPVVAERLKEADLDQYVYQFDPDSFNPSIPLGGNLMFASPLQDISQTGLAANTKFMTLVHEQGLADDGIAISQAVIDTLDQTFGRDGTDHPLFRMLGIEEDLYEKLIEIAEKRRTQGAESLTSEENALMLTVPFALTAEQIGPSFPDRYKRKIVEIRKTRAAALRDQVRDIFVEISPDTYLPRLTLMENALYGRISRVAGAYAEEIEDVVATVLLEKGLKRKVSETIYDLETGLGGANLPKVIQERAAFSRAGIKRPDILILDRALASHDDKNRVATREKLRELLPNTTQIFMEAEFRNPDSYDIFVEIKNGRIGTISDHDSSFDSLVGSDDLQRKQRIIANTDLFSRLDRKNQRLLAFSAQWYEAKAGQRIFSVGQRADAAYLCLSGTAELHWPESDGTKRPISTVQPGRVIGDLAIVLNEPRTLDLIAMTDAKFLRIGAQEYRAVIESDPAVAMNLLQTVAGHLNGAAERLRHAGISPEDRTEGTEAR